METAPWTPSDEELKDLGLLKEFCLADDAPHAPVQLNAMPADLPEYGPADLRAICETRVTAGTATDFLGWLLDQQRQRADWAQRGNPNG